MKKYILSVIGFFSVFSVAMSQVPENVYIHTDKSAYHAGEIIWMRADVVNGSTGKPLAVSKVVYVELLDADNKPVLQEKIGTMNAVGKGYFDIPFNIATGNYVLRAYTNWMKNFSSDYFFHKAITIYNINDTNEVLSSLVVTPTLNPNLSVKDLSINITADKKEYNSRSRIVLDISTPVDASVSISVYKIDSLQQPDQTNIKERLSRSLTALPADRSSYKYPPEYYGHIITGKIVDAVTDAPAAGMAGYISVSGLPQFFRSAVSDDAGNISFHLKNFYGIDEVVCQTDSRTDSNYIVKLNNPFSNNYTSFRRADSLPLSGIASNLRVRQGVSAQVQYAYFASMRDRYSVPVIDTLLFYGNPEKRYIVDEYVKFGSMEDVLREYVIEIGVQMRNGKPFPFVFDQLRRKPFTTHPFFLVNGMPVFDVNRLMAIAPEVLETIDVVDWRYFLNGKSYEGIASINTRKRSIEDFGMESNAVVADYKGLQLDRIFYSPKYETEDPASARLPDFRSVLFWSPDVLLSGGNSQKIEFYSSDIKGEFIVVVQGIGKNGEAGKSVFSFNVK